MENSPGNSSDCDGSRYIGPAASNTFQYLQKSRGKEGEADQWSPSLFQLIPLEDNYPNVEKSDLYKNIRRAGGSNYPGRELDRDIPGVMRILNEDYYKDNEEEDILIPLDTYSSAFIYRCISNKNAGLPPPHPWKYLIPTATSKYGSKYDARKILREELDWDRINNRFVFPPIHKRVTARQWIENLRRMEAELDSETAAAAVQNEDLTSSGDRIQNATPTTNTAVASPVVNLTDPVPSTSRGTSASSSQNLRRRIVVESESDEDDVFEPYAVTKGRIRKSARRLTPSPSSSQNSPDSTKSGQDPTAVNKRWTRLTRTKNFMRLGLHRNSTTSRSSSPKQLRKSNGKTAAFSEGENETVPSTGSKKPSQTSPCKSTPSKENEKSSRHPAATVAAPSSSKKATGKPPTPRPTNKAVTVAGTRKSSLRGSKSQSPPVSNNGRVNSDLSSDESVYFSESEDSEDSDADKKRNVKPERRPYSTEDGQHLLDLVITHDAYRYVKGNRFWQLVAKSNKSDGRTFQSMRDHFLKTVKPKVFSRRTRNIYKISPENLAKWKEANKDQGHKYYGFCPDYEI